MAKYHHRLTCCDRDCAGANRCGAMGGVRCPDCGMWYCPAHKGDEEGRCDDCADTWRREQEDGQEDE